MKTIQYVTLGALAVVLSGCVTTSKVEEMIAASQQDQSSRVDSHEASIDVLKQSAVAGLEKSKENAVTIETLKAQLADLQNQVKINKGYAEASKVMSAANTVKVAELDETLNANSAADEETKRLLSESDKLYEGVMMAHYQMIADSATAAIESLKAGGPDAPVAIDAPIEIVAPATEPTNAPAPME